MIDLLGPALLFSQQGVQTTLICLAHLRFNKLLGIESNNNDGGQHETIEIREPFSYFNQHIGTGKKKKNQSVVPAQEKKPHKQETYNPIMISC